MNPTQLDELYITDNIIIGAGEVVAVRHRKEVYWVLPGGERTYVRNEAIRYAERLDSVIRANLASYKRKLFR